MKNILKMKIVVITSIVCFFISGVIGVAAVSLTASDVKFNSKDENWNPSNVNDAMNDLYELEKECNGNMELVDTYFKSMDTIKNDPKGNLLNKINIEYGNFETFRKDFINRAKALTGSGYTFLVSNNRGDLTIVNLVNQETPFSYGLVPLFALDLWEHAYYLQYKNDRNGYIENFFNKASFKNAEEIYNKIVLK